MASNNDVANALLAKFYSLLTAGGGAPPGAFISYVDGGYPFSDADLVFLQEGQLLTNLGPAARFAALVNTVPKAAGTWAATGKTLSMMYKDWMNLAKVPGITLTADQQKELASATTTAKRLYLAYRKYQTAYVNAVNAMESLVTTIPQPSNYIVKLHEAVEARTQAEQAWQTEGSRAEYEQAAAQVQALSSQGYAGILSTLQTAYTDYVQFFLDPDTQTQFAPVLAIPADFMDGVTWNTFTFNTSETEKYVNNSRTSFGGGLSGMEDLFLYSASVNGSVTSTSVQVDTSSLSVSMEYVRVALDRSAWFDPFLLESNAWWYPGATRAHPARGGPRLSDGAPPPSTQGEWQATPQEVVFTRNLVISMDMSNETNQTAVTTMEAQADVKFLIWPVAQAHAYYNNSTSSYTFQKTDQGIYAPQTQMTAFICSLMPPEPNPQPALLPPDRRARDARASRALESTNEDPERRTDHEQFRPLPR